MIIAISIPLSVLGSIIALSAIGETLNIMTLGGLALAVGILVDDATVTIENINWHLEQGKDVETAIMDGAAQIVTPAFVSLLCICIVFVPMFFLEGVARFLFVPMAVAVMFAMVCSFILSRTLVPTMAKYLLRRTRRTRITGHESAPPRAIRWCASSAASRRASNGARRLSRAARTGAASPARVRDRLPGLRARLVRAGAVSRPQLLSRRRYRPDPDACARAGRHARRGDSARQFAEIQKAIRQIIPPDEIEALVDNIGLPVSGINMTYNNTGTIGSQDGDIQITLREGHRPTAEYVCALREELPRRFPGVTFSFLPADIVSQILNFGAPAPIDLQIRGATSPPTSPTRRSCCAGCGAFRGSSTRASSSRRRPGFNVDMDRTRAQYVGVTGARRDQQPGRQPRRQQPGGADLLAQSGQRRVLSDRDADAAISDGFA